MTLLLRHEEIVQLVSMGDAIEALREGFREQARGQVVVPPRLTVDSSAGWIRTMPAIMNDSGCQGLKVMHSTHGVGVGYIISLYELRTGKLLAWLDADWITQLRTAATSALGADYLAPRHVRQVAVFGSGEQARSQLRAMRCVRTFDRVKVYSPTKARREAFAADMSAELGIRVETVDRPDEAVRGSNLIVIAIRAGDRPAFLGQWLEPGMHVSGMSSVRPMAREVDDATWEESDRIAVDDRDHVLESGDGRSLLKRGTVPVERLVELHQLVAGSQLARQGDQEITLFKSVGTALQDLALAARVYALARREGVGQELNDFPRLR